MFYKKNTASGNSGEFYFAYWISRNFNWPCRLLNIDVGIDAQVEVFDDNTHSTGNFLAVQIKTTGKRSPNVSVTMDNLEYWKTIDDVVILISITMANKKPNIFWKVINDSDIDSYIEDARKNDKSKTTTIRFNKEDILEPRKKRVWAMLPYKGIDLPIKKYTKEIIEICDENNAHFFDGNDYSPSSVDIEYEFIIDDFNRACQTLDDLESTVGENYKICNIIDSIGIAREKHEIFTKNITEYISYLFKVNYEFKHEYKERWSYPNVHPIFAEIVDEKINFNP